MLYYYELPMLQYYESGVIIDLLHNALLL